MKAKPPLRYRAMFSFLRAFFRVLLKRYSFETDMIPPLDEPFVLVSNHTTDLDFAIVGIASREVLYYVVDQSLMKVPVLGKLLAFFAEPSAITQNNVSVSTMAQILGRVRDGYNLAIFPEGRHSYDGVTVPSKTSIGKLVKRSGGALVTFRIEGGYFFKPRWSRVKRVGPLKGHVAGVYSSEELAGMSDSEVTDIINRDTFEDAYASQEKNRWRYTGRSRAVGLEKYCFICPACGSMESIETEGDKVRCNVCGVQAGYDDCGFLVSTQGALPYQNVRDWGAFVSGRFDRIAAAAVPEELLGEYRVNVRTEVRASRKSHGHKASVKKNTGFRLYKDHYEISGKDYPFADVRTVRVRYADILSFTAGNERLTISGSGFYAWKCARTWHIFKGDDTPI